MAILLDLKHLAWTLSFLFTIYIAYYAVFSLLSLKRSKALKECAPQNRFAIVIAARNEACVIGNLVESLMVQNYPKELYDVYVVPNNCTDNTGAAAREAGALLLECRVPVKSKGQVLNDAFDQLLSGGGYDAFCVFDADNLVHQDFLKSMNNALCAGARVGQAYRDSKNPYDSVVSGCYSVYYWMINRLINHTRSVVGLSAIINGSGFMVRADLLQEMGGWHTFTMTEDIEFTTQCLLRGEKVMWVPDARIYDEQPVTFAQSWKQRKRWSTGLLQGFELYFTKLVKAVFVEKKVNCIDQMVFLLAPCMQVIYIASLAVGLLLDLCYVKYDLFPEKVLYYKMFVSLNVSYLTTLALSVYTIIMERKSSLRILGGAAAYWLFIVSWIPINIICLFRKTTTWDEIKHTRNVSIDEISGGRKQPSFLKIT
ncbi:glycosyltransferase family 2 protein [Marasmitruncus massiliensis]|uniref:glycosyltransferase family 2 protein n=1 Tax=Marasmitruncus massiliensis TaxID=1944642 RepID=UPI0015E0CE83|nr:glycosyltransferase family 2 protein [Marasmitruncus massiliensis]